MYVLTINCGCWNTLKYENIFYYLGLLYSVFPLFTHANILIGFILPSFLVRVTEWYSIAETKKCFHAQLSGEIDFVLISNMKTFLDLDWLQLYENKLFVVKLTS